MWLHLHCGYCSNSFNMSCKKTDDVFSLWDVNRKDIDLFIEQANTFDPTISHIIITFLETVVYKGDRFLKEAILDVKTHYKPTETFQYTEYLAGQIHNLTKGVGFG